MTDLFQSIDDRTNLAGTNRLEVLTFRLNGAEKSEDSELYGINVFKVRELMTVPELINIPESLPSHAGVANIRGKSVPVIDLNHYCGFPASSAPGILIVTEFNCATQGFLVNEVDNIMQLDWRDIVEPPELVSRSHGNVLTAMSRLEDDRILLLLDVEKVLADTLYVRGDMNEVPVGLPDSGKFVFFADDSKVARRQVEMMLNQMGLAHQSANNGVEAWDNLQALADRSEASGQPLSDTLSAIITDVEMPYMDGYVLTSMIKKDSRFDGISVMMHSSLSAAENKRLGMKVGADAYIAKLVPKEFKRALNSLIAA